MSSQIPRRLLCGARPRVLLPLILAVFLLSACTWVVQPETSEAKPIRFRGSVARGETFAHEFAPGLSFRLKPYGEDWEFGSATGLIWSQNQGRIQRQSWGRTSASL